MPQPLQQHIPEQQQPASQAAQRGSSAPLAHPACVSPPHPCTFRAKLNTKRFVPSVPSCIRIFRQPVHSSNPALHSHISPLPPAASHPLSHFHPAPCPACKGMQPAPAHVRPAWLTASTWIPSCHTPPIQSKHNSPSVPARVPLSRHSCPVSPCFFTAACCFTSRALGRTSL